MIEPSTGGLQEGTPRASSDGKTSPSLFTVESYSETLIDVITYNECGFRIRFDVGEARALTLNLKA